MHPLERNIEQGVHRDGVIRTGDGIVVGVSAGSDSTALLTILAALSRESAFRILAMYIDHGLRPEETPAEWTHVSSVADRLGVDATRVHVQTKAYAAEKKYSLEKAARILRYQAFEERRRYFNGNWIAVAHTADDQAEEVLIRLLRGSSRKALSGMQRIQGNIIRPLLQVKKHELQTYLEEKGFSWHHDSSNDDVYFLRNRIRHELLPLLEREYDPGIRGALCKTAENLAGDEALLEELTRQMRHKLLPDLLEHQAIPLPLAIERKTFLTFHCALQRRFVEQLLWELGNTARYEYIVKIVEAVQYGRSGSELHFSKGLRVQVSRETVTFSYPRGMVAWRGSLSPPKLSFRE